MMLFGMFLGKIQVLQKISRIELQRQKKKLQLDAVQTKTMMSVVTARAKITICKRLQTR